MRVAPVVFVDCPPVNHAGNETLLPILRALVTALVSAEFQTDAVVEASYRARPLRSLAHQFSGEEQIASVDIIQNVIGGAAALTDPGRPADEFRDGYFAQALSSADSLLGEELWKQFGKDLEELEAGSDLLETSLWYGDNLYAEQWLSTDQVWRKHEDVFGFWGDWYARILAGKRPDLDWLEAIATGVEPSVWAGPEDALAEAISFLKPDLVGSADTKSMTELRSRIQEALKEMRDFRLQAKQNLQIYVDDAELAEQKRFELEQKHTAWLEEAEEQRQSLDKNFEEQLKAAEIAYRQKLGLEEPVKLWETKEEEHSRQMRSAYRQFLFGLISMAGLIVLTLMCLLGWPNRFLEASQYLTGVLSGPACDPAQNPGGCASFFLKPVILTASVLTLFTLVLWFVRLKMKEYLAERHLMLDARERRAFAQTYLGLLAINDSSDEAKEQRSTIYAALFRHGSDGIIKDEGGLDPSIAAALSKFLSK